MSGLYNGNYPHGVDEKRRVQIPAKWRPADGEKFEFTMIVWPKYPEGVCLRMLPPTETAKLLGSLSNIDDSNPIKPTLKRLIGSNSTQVELDKAGRACIPETMAAAAGIKDEAVLVGMMDRFEIWSPERLEKRKATDSALTAEAFKSLE